MAEMTDQQLEAYLSELEEKERERDRAEGVFDPLINMNFNSDTQAEAETSEQVLASVFSNMAKEAWPHQDEEPNFSMDQFRDPSMEMTTEPTTSGAEASAFKVLK